MVGKERCDVTQESCTCPLTQSRKFSDMSETPKRNVTICKTSARAAAHDPGSPATLSSPRTPHFLDESRRGSAARPWACRCQHRHDYEAVDASRPQALHRHIGQPVAGALPKTRSRSTAPRRARSTGAGLIWRIDSQCWRSTAILIVRQSAHVCQRLTAR